MKLCRMKHCSSMLYYWSFRATATSRMEVAQVFVFGASHCPEMLPAISGERQRQLYARVREVATVVVTAHWKKKQETS
jgi:hypothetical protein